MSLPILHDGLPRQCHGVTSSGQCPMHASPHSKYCDAHGGGPGSKKALKETFNRYLITREEVRTEYERQAGDPDLLDFTDDLHLLSALYSRAINQADSSDDKYLAARLVPVVKQIESLRKSLFEMQQKTGLLWSQAAVVGLMKSLAEIVTDELMGVDNRAEIVDRIVVRFMAAFEKPPQEEEE